MRSVRFHLSMQKYLTKQDVKRLKLLTFFGLLILLLTVYQSLTAPDKSDLLNLKGNIVNARCLNIHDFSVSIEAANGEISQFKHILKCSMVVTSEILNEPALILYKPLKRGVVSGELYELEISGDVYINYEQEYTKKITMWALGVLPLILLGFYFLILIAIRKGAGET